MNPTQQLEAAVAHHRAGRLGEAEALYRSVLARHPRQADALNLLGVLRRQAGDARAAERLIRRAIAVRPGSADFRNHLGDALLAQGRAGDAAAAFRRALAIDPRHAAAAFNLGLALEQAGDPAGAVQAYRQAAALEPGATDGLGRLGGVLHALGRLGEAAAAFRRGLEVDPDDAGLHAGLGAVCLERGELPQALAALRRAVELAPGEAALHVRLGNAFEVSGDAAQARASYERAAGLDPRDAEAQCCLGRVRQAAGDLAGAEACFREALALRPGYGAALYHLAAAGRLEAGGAELRAVEDRLRTGALPEHDATLAQFALGRAYDRAGRYEEAFDRIRRGNALKRARLQYDPAMHTAHVDRLIRTFAASGEAASGVDAELPVLIVGMPRSGTTLIEQIVSRHPQVHGAGEIDALERVRVRLGEALAAHGPWPECAAHLDAELAATLAREYLERLEAGAGTALRVTDKMPHNFLGLGLVQRLLPRARVIHCRREPLDTCLSIYFLSFPGGHPYAYDLAELGHYYREYLRLMAHWRRMLGERMLEIDYEALVRDPEAESRRLIEFTGLEWDACCLDFTRNERAVLSASSWQVRQPIHAGSIGRWRHYEAQLAPLREALAGQPPAASDEGA